MAFLYDRTYNFDANLILSDNAAPYTATGFTQVGGSSAIIDLGGNQGVSPKQQARIEFAVVCDVFALDLSSGNETYRMVVLGSNDPAFGAGSVEQLGEIMLGKAASRDGINMMDSVIGRYEILCSNQLGGTTYQYLALYLVIGGTTPSLTLSAFLAALPMK